MGYFRWIRAVEARLDSRARVGRESRLRTHCNARGRVGARGTCHRDGASGGPRPPFREAAREEGQQDVLRLHDAEPEVDVEKLWRVRVLGLQRNPIARSAVHISQVKSANMDRWSKEELDLFRVSGGEPESADVLRAARVGARASAGRISQKYTSRAAGLYKQFLARERSRRRTARCRPRRRRTRRTRPGSRTSSTITEKEFETIAGRARPWSSPRVREARRAHARRRESVRPRARRR